MLRQFPIVFNQLEYIQPLGKGIQTIAQSGCYLCSFATLAKACGKNITPVSLNQTLIDKLLYVNQNEQVDDNLTKVFPDLVYQESLHYETIPADLEKLRSLMADPSTWVILEIDLGSGFTHFVLCAGINGVVSIADPEGGVIIDFASKYGDPAKNILKFVVYKGTPVIMDGTVDQQALIDQLRTDRDKNWNLYQEEEKKNADLTTENTNLQTNISQVQKRNSELATQIADMEKADSTAVDKGIALQGLVTDLQDYIHAIADSVKVHYDSSKIKDTVELILGAIAALKKPVDNTPPVQQPLDTNTTIANNGNILMSLYNAIKRFIWIPKV